MPAVLLPDFQLRALTRDDAHALFVLRYEAYAGSPQFALRTPAALEWSESDDRSLVLGVWRRDRSLLSTVRLQYQPSRDSAEAALEHDLEAVPHSAFPGAVAGRSATDRRCARAGLSALLRVVLLRLVLSSDLRCLLAVVYEGAPRLQSLFDAGYVRHDCARHWDRECSPLTQPFVVRLMSVDYPRALQTATAQAARLLPVTRIDWPSINERFNRLLAMDQS